MNIDLNDLNAFISVVQANGFRNAARISNVSASKLSEAIRRLETQLGVRLLHRSTRSIALTEVGADLLSQLRPAMAEVQSALTTINHYRDRPAGLLKLNVPASVTKLILPQIIPAFLEKYPDITIEIISDENFVDIVSAGCDAGIRYGERLEQDMIAIPIGPRSQRIATVASPTYLDRYGRPKHPQELVQHSCLRGRFPSGAMPIWTFEHDDEIFNIDPKSPLIIGLGGSTDLLIDSALAGIGIIHLLEDWLSPHLRNGALEPILKPWWQSIAGPFLYYSGRHFIPSPLKLFIEFIRSPSISEHRYPEL